MRSFVSLTRCCVLAAFASLTALAGCAVQAADTSDVASTSEALSTLGKSIVGEWDRTDGAGLVDITFQSDGTYFEDDQVYCFRAPCPPIRVKGAWSLSSASSTKGTLRLHPADGGTKTYALAYASSGPTLTLTASGTTLQLHRPAPAAGSEGATCGGIAALPCNDGLYCVIRATYPDASGVCRARGELGTPCGGIAGFPCNAGLVCQITDQGTSDPMGTCVVQ